jgi:phosphatidylglycerol:prolipoprotein diacylglycerol transferase
MIPFVHLGPITLPTFGLMVATAMFCAYFLLAADLRRRNSAGFLPRPPQNQRPIDAETLVAIPSLAGIVGAKLYHVLETPSDLFAHPFAELFSAYGFAWFGGLIAGIAAFIYLGRKHHIPLLLLFDIASPASALGYGVGRIGCLLSGDGDYGIPTSLPWGMSFPNGVVPTTARVHPTPIYEFLAALLITWILWRLGSRQFAPAAASSAAASHSRLAYGAVFAWYLILTGVARFLVEFIRINPRSFLGLTNAQAASLVSIVLGAALLFRLHGGVKRSEPLRA